MKTFIKKISYKMLVVSMITIVLSFFCASSVSQAKLTIDEGEFYYSGTQDAEYVVKVSVWDKILNSLSDIVNYIVGAITLVFRGVVVGWVEIAEMILTKLLTLGGDLGTVNDNDMNSYTQKQVTVEKILFNDVPILNANIFDNETEEEIEEQLEEVIEENDNVIAEKGAFVIKVIRENVAKWYYVMRLIVIAFMLLLLIYIGIRMLISNIAEEKAVYKRMLVDWVVGLVIVFAIHYIMIFIINVNDDVVEALRPLAKTQTEIREEYEYGDEKNLKTSSEIESTLYETARTNAYDIRLTVGFSGMVIYAVMVYYAWRFAIMYLRRVINIMLLTLMAPAVSASYAFNKAVTGKAKVFSAWLKEYIMNVVIQIVHVILYVTFFSIAMELTLVSLPGVILAFILLRFMLEGADKLLRQIFKLDGGQGSLAGDMADRTSFRDVGNRLKAYGDMLVGGKLTKEAMKGTYRLVTKPARFAAEKTFSSIMEAKANDERYQQSKKENDEREEQKAQEAYDEFRNSTGQENEWDEITRQRLALLDKRVKLQEKQLRLQEEENEAELEKNQKKIKATEKQLELNEQRIKEFEEREAAIQEAFLLHYKEETSLSNTLVENIKKAFDPERYLDRVKVGEDENGKPIYKYKKIKTVREGGSDWAFWHKKTDSVGQRFIKNVKFNKLLGISDAEAKVLKDEAKFLGGAMTGVLASLAVFPAMAIEPSLGLYLLRSSNNI